MPPDCLIQIVTSEFFAKLWAPDFGNSPPPPPPPAITLYVTNFEKNMPSVLKKSHMYSREKFKEFRYV
jgi:hypothetical protein